MTSTGGLSRRRVAASASSNTEESDDAWGLNGSSSRHTPTPSLSNSTTSTTNGAVTHAGSAFQGGSKIAYDPRDLEREDEDARQGGKAPRLTIMEEVLLLGLKDKQVSSHPERGYKLERFARFALFEKWCKRAVHESGCCG